MDVASWVVPQGPLLGQSVFKLSRSAWDMVATAQRGKMAQPARTWCKINRRQAHAHAEVVRSIADLRSLLLGIKNQYASYHGDKGVPRHIRQRWSDWSTAFNFSAWVDGTGLDDPVAAFERLWRRLCRDLSKTEASNIASDSWQEIEATNGPTNSNQEPN